MTPDQQLDALKSLRAQPHRVWWAPAALVSALALVGVALIWQSSAWAAAAAVLTALGWALTRVDRHRLDAITAAQHGARAMARVSLSAAQRDGARAWRAIVQVDMLSEWGFEFEPRHWEPSEGTFMAEICFLPDVPWPALVLTGQGLLYPSTGPRRRIPRGEDPKGTS